jgi:hypothetical protein
MSKKRKPLSARFSDGMIVTAGDEVLWDGEAHALGIKPFKTVAEIEANRAAFRKQLDEYRAAKRKTR